MCDKGTWVKDIHSNHLFQGFFHMKHDHSKILLTDASGSIPANHNGCRILKGLSGNTIWASGRATEDINGHSINVLSALPTEHWTGNPFALIDPMLPGFKHSSALYYHVQSIQDQEVRRIIDMFFADTGLMRGFMSSPGSLKHHHAFPGGLAEHTVETLDMASQICTTLSQKEHALVIAACLLHDTGKAFEYSGNYKHLSQRGRLLGHEITLLEWLSPLADKIWSRGDPKRLMLFHLLTAKPAPQWTGIRHPRNRLVSIVRFADSWSAKANPHSAHLSFKTTNSH